MGLHIYPGFDDSFRTVRLSGTGNAHIPMGMRRVDADGNNVLQKQLQNASDLKVDFIWLESWNDFSEQTAIAPSLYVQGEKRSDPFQDLKTIADYKGKTFTPAPLPPRTSIDPLMQPVLFK